MMVKIRRTWNVGRSAGLVLLVLIIAVPTGLVGAQGVDPEAGPWMEERPTDPVSWHRDATGDGVDDRLEAAVAEGVTGEVMAELHYDRRPTDKDVDLLRSDYHVVHAYKYNNWDEILVRVDHRHVLDLIDAPGVVAVEWVPPATLDLNTSTSAIRVSENPLVADGFDHSQAVHETFGLRGEGMVIAVMDTGVDNAHVSLQDTLVFKVDPLDGGVVFGAADVSSGLTTVGCIDPMDHHGHGTHVAGTALGRGGGSTRPGVAPEARLVEIAITGVSVGGINGMSVGLDWLLDYNAGTSCYGDPGEDRVDVLSISFSLSSNNPEDSLNRKFTDVVQSGITVVFSAGNAGPGTSTVTKGVEGAILVGADDDIGSIRRGDDRLAPFSSRGPRPSNELTVRDMMPHVSAPGVAISAPRANSGTGAAIFSGTSMAAPHVAGLAALILQANESLRPVGHEDWRLMGEPGSVPVRDVLAQSAQYREEVWGTDPQVVRTGMYGLKWNNAWGYGLVDGHRAIQVAMDPELAPPPDPPEPPEPVVPDEALIWNGTIGCSLNYPSAFQPWTCPDESNDTQHNFTVQPGLKSLVVAMVWEPAEFCTAQHLRHWLFVPAEATRAAVRAEGGAPLEYRVDAGDTMDLPFEEIEEPTDLRFRVWGPNSGFQFCHQQPFEVHYHLFYEEHAHAGYSAVPVDT